jgi:hypothetical protein
MPKTIIHFEVVPVKEVEKILKRQNPSASHSGNRKAAAKKRGEKADVPRARSKKSGGSTS